ncbi:MAG: hypothetical protein KGY75_01120 [Candidatus Cloacimonetes bacterium]|nr:hypothetical protein [Candidatus Cloacimonadota bacterium]MBS3766713.1 hypothetical protein [Candidatus Cloacimonadota bacterium]
MDNNKIQSFYYLPLSSEIQAKSSKKILKKYNSFLKKIGGRQAKESEIGVKDPIVFFILTGGTENHVLKLIDELAQSNKNKLLLITHPNNNSLPAALEISAKLQQENLNIKIVYISDSNNQFAAEEILEFVCHYQVHKKLQSSKIGLIGKPSEWLVASSPNKKIIENNWHVEVKKIPLKKVYTLYENITDKKIDFELEKNPAIPAELAAIKRTELLKAIKIYLALKKIIKQEQLDAITIRCFDLIQKKHVTGCLALALLNKKNIISGCEADIVSTLTMLWLYYLAHKKSWMANPARIDLQNNSILLAHCTISMDMAQEFTFPTHFESGINIGIQGKILPGEVTLVRIGGKELDKLWVAEGNIKKNTKHANLCRTQVRVSLDEKDKAKELLAKPLGNHLILVTGKIKSKIVSYFEFMQKQSGC